MFLICNGCRTKSLKGAGHLDAENIFRERRAVVTYCLPSESVYKNAKQNKLREFCKNFYFWTNRCGQPRASVPTVIETFKCILRFWFCAEWTRSHCLFDNNGGTVRRPCGLRSSRISPRSPSRRRWRGSPLKTEAERCRFRDLIAYESAL
jgi:hypothetical protein